MPNLISIVVPCYNEREALPIFYRALIPQLEQMNVSIELIFVDDGSTDETPDYMKKLSSEDGRAKYILLSKNFGKEAAMLAGFKAAKGDYVAVMDADLQDPPEKLAEMYQILQKEDCDCVATRRVTRSGEPKIRSFFARQFYKLINRISEVEIVDGARDFRLMRRKMVDAILSLKEYNRFSKGIFTWVGFKTKWLEYENAERCAGETKWSFTSLFRYAIDGIIAFSTKPLTMIGHLGGSFILLDILLAILFTILHFTTSFTFEPWLILFVLILFLFGILLCCLGTIAVYQAKIYSEVKGRPAYIIKEDNIDKE